MAKLRIAILGAGPIGLEAALYARTLGHTVMVFEQGQVADGGQMLMQELIVRCVHTDRTPGLPEQVENGFGQFHLVQVDRTTV